MTPTQQEGKNHADHLSDPSLANDSAFEWLAKIQPLDLNSCAYKNFKYCPTTTKSDSSHAYIFKPQKSKASLRSISQKKR